MERIDANCEWHFQCCPFQLMFKTGKCWNCFQRAVGWIHLIDGFIDWTVIENESGWTIPSNGGNRFNCVPSIRFSSMNRTTPTRMWNSKSALVQFEAVGHQMIHCRNQRVHTMSLPMKKCSNRRKLLVFLLLLLLVLVLVLVFLIFFRCWILFSSLLFCSAYNLLSSTLFLFSRKMFPSTTTTTPRPPSAWVNWWLGFLHFNDWLWPPPRLFHFILTLVDVAPPATVQWLFFFFK